MSHTSHSSSHASDDHHPHNHHRRFDGQADALRAERRVSLMEVPRAVDLALAGLTLTTVLDVGTGSGLFAEEFARRGLQVVGVDLREDMLAVARRHVPSAEFRLGRMEHLPCTDGEFDLVFLGHVLHETDDLHQALSEARRVARQRVVIFEWPYQDEEHGPPLHHRLAPETIRAAAAAADIPALSEIQLNHMVLFRLDI